MHLGNYRVRHHELLLYSNCQHPPSIISHLLPTFLSPSIGPATGRRATPGCLDGDPYASFSYGVGPLLRSVCGFQLCVRPVNGQSLAMNSFTLICRSALCVGHLLYCPLLDRNSYEYPWSHRISGGCARIRVMFKLFEKGYKNAWH